MTMRHLVLLRFKLSTSDSEKESIEQAFAILPKKIQGISAFEWGLNVSHEGLTKGFSHVFSLTFEDAKARDEYLPHPLHQSFVKQLSPFMEDVLVIDYEVSDEV